MMYTNIWGQICNGDATAMKALYQNSYQQLYAYGFRLTGDKDKTKDALHELFCELWEARTSLKQVKHVIAYLKVCLRNKLLKQLKLDAFIVNIADFPEVENLAELSYEALLIKSEQNESNKIKLELSLAKLTPMQREIIKLKFFDGLDYESISNLLALKHRTVYNHVYTAISSLKDIFNA